VSNDHTLTAIKDRLAEVRDSLGEAHPSIPVGEIIARARRRRVRRRMACGTTGVLALAAGAAVALTALPPASHRAPTGPALATAYVVHRVEDAFANDGQVMRESISLDAPNSGSAAFFDGQQSYQSVTWAYRGQTSSEVFGARGQRQGSWGTGIVNGKLQAVQVDYIRHQWELIPGNSFGAPVNACTNTGFLDAPNSPGTNWPLLITRTLACGGYKMAGYAEINGAETVKITGSRVVGTGSAESTMTVTLFVSPSTYLPVQITQSIASPGLHGSLTSVGIQWLRPTAANRARASVTVPCGYQQISWPSGQPTTGQPSTGQPNSACG
jgi:hypothetical protein